ncbi:hypothetical protein O181_047932 [Austropuccinia psidii MF-1]|uniref:Uncharacterized protein n=1 Tax=Austropuccinia psidii MF-1 TaxID=1389203 RepID=A0A9Q3DYU5_9BASI|nr:hypothetical protein [Austropuccinia psidii MF-1]
MKPQPQHNVMDNTYHQDEIKPDGMLLNKARSSSQYQDGDNTSYSKKEALKHLPEASSRPKLSETGGYDHMELSQPWQLPSWTPYGISVPYQSHGNLAISIITGQICPLIFSGLLWSFHSWGQPGPFTIIRTFQAIFCFWEISGICNFSKTNDAIRNSLDILTSSIPSKGIL